MSSGEEYKHQTEFLPHKTEIVLIAYCSGYASKLPGRSARSSDKTEKLEKAPWGSQAFPSHLSLRKVS